MLTRKVLQHSLFSNYPTRLIVTNTLKVLGIESTCDDTCAAVVNSDQEILSDVRYSQLVKHVNYGGIIAVVARDRHVTHINDVVKESLNRASLTINDIDAIAVATKPGLQLSLEVGVEYAKSLCLKYNKPLISIHHMEAHALIGLLSHPHINFPFLTLLISGGHSIIALVKDYTKFYVLADAPSSPIGETLDKIARELKIKNLGPPFDEISGGQAIELIAKNGNPQAYPFDRYNKQSNRFSFGQFRTLANKLIHKCKRNHPNLPVDCPLPEVADIAASLQRAIAEYIGTSILYKVKIVESLPCLIDEDIDYLLDISSPSFHHQKLDFLDHKPLHLQLVISGGVACNNYITEKLKEHCNNMETIYDDTRVDVIVPTPKHLCTDNGVMIAWNGVLKLTNLNKKDVLLSDYIQMMSLEPVRDACLGRDLSEIIGLPIGIKPLQIR